MDICIPIECQFPQFITFSMQTLNTMKNGATLFLKKMSKNVDFETCRDSTNFEVGVLSTFLL